MRTLGVVVIGWCLPFSTLTGQRPTFDVASIKPSKIPDGRTQFLPSGFTAIGTDLYWIVVEAYGVKRIEARLKIPWPPERLKQILITPFDIQAKGEGGEAAQRAMLRTLLAERFGLKAHTETRQVPIYAMILKEPGKLGMWLKPSNINCEELFEAGKFRTVEDQPTDCRFTSERRYDARVQRWAGTMADLAYEAQQHSGRPVVDATGLSGSYAWELAIPRIESTSREALMKESFESQLGLRMEPRIGPYEVIVIDAVRMPTPN